MTYLYLFKIISLHETSLWRILVEESIIIYLFNYIFMLLHSYVVNFFHSFIISRHVQKNLIDYASMTVRIWITWIRGWRKKLLDIYFEVINARSSDYPEKVSNIRRFYYKLFLCYSTEIIRLFFSMWQVFSMEVKEPETRNFLFIVFVSVSLINYPYICL